ncbi:uncharacterized protein LOC6571193 [Drosophila grimshawi]|uniref:uncharacterized protein LOC6571193 n=1 Tax=Drosophila grimshawi TaxID=7222 RepID=UPI001C931D61|nr:uncharacterized protein LOC6571193 [Drosophila grimshawi]
MRCYVTVFLILKLLVSFSLAAKRLPRVLPHVEANPGVPVHGDCEFHVNGDLNDPAPLFARHNFFELIVPDPTDTVSLTNGELFDMFCPGAGFAAPFEKRTQLTVQCLQHKYFLVDGLIYPFMNFTCADWPTFTALRTGRECNGGTDLVKVGFQLDDDGFLQTYDVCHDELAEVTRYVHHVLYPSSYDYQHGVARPRFVELDFYGGRDVNTKYTQKEQNITISDILGMDASPYFNYSEDLFLARGHIVAKTDQIFGAAQMSTFLFINVAPQWQTFNGGNWEKVESSVRKFVADRNLTADCYTGTWGVSTLPDANGIERELYLDFDENNNGLIPVPKLYFRVIIDRENREGIVLVGVNNPYVTLEQIQSDYILCEDIGHRLSWVSWLKEDLLEGYSYACTVEDFTEVVKDLPLEDLHTNGVLGLDDIPTTAPPESTTQEPSTTGVPSTTPADSTTVEPSTTSIPSTTPADSTTQEPSTTSVPSTTPADSTTQDPSTTGVPSTTPADSTTVEPSTTGVPSTTPADSTTQEPSTTGVPSTTPADSTTQEPSSTSVPSTTPPSSTSVPSTTPADSTTVEPSTTSAPSTTPADSTTQEPSTTGVPSTTTADSTTQGQSTAVPTTTDTPVTPTSAPISKQCHFSLTTDLKDPAPLLTPEGYLRWLLPNESGVYIVDDGTSIDMHCTAAMAAPFNRYTALTAHCLGNQIYEAEGLEVDVRSFSCQTWPTYEAMRTGKPCAGGTELLQIGFNVAAGMLPHLEICYDEQTQITRYVRYELTPANVAYQRNVAQPGYIRAGFYSNKDVNMFYGQAHQHEVLSETLGMDASIYLDSSRDLYLTRGQLAARQDFVHGSEQRATHFYVNAVPQWRSITIGNWLAVERSLRQFVANEALNVSVHAGSWGVSTLPNAHGQQTEIYLDSSEKQLPVPRLVYRIVIDQVSRKGIALVVVNNPHASLAETLQDYVVCDDIGAKLNWLDWEKTELMEGYSYACDVNDFTAVVKDLPLDDLHTTGLLGVSEGDKDSVCNFKVNGDLKDPAPLFVLRDAEGKAEYLQPNAQGVVEMKHGETFEMHCSGTKGSFTGHFADTAWLNASCWQEHSFLVLGSVHQLQDFVCKSWPSYTARRTDRSCNGGTNLLEVGFQLANDGEQYDDFLQTYDVCHNELAEVTRYVHHVLNPSSAQYQRSVSRPSFITGDFYGGKDVNGKYTQVQQNITISEILGMDASPYFDISGNVYLARGHLSAKTDFIFGAAQQATFFFVNAAPQWQTFNAGNWERIEDSVRKFVADEKITVDCYTGTWGVSTLPDVNGVPQELYLDFDENNNGLIPVPMLYFRVIIDRDSRKGVVLVGVNNPHASLQQIHDEYIICPDIGDQINWISWTKEDLKKGYSYACTVEDFTEVVKDLPLDDLQTNGVLGISTSFL